MANNRLYLCAVDADGNIKKSYSLQIISAVHGIIAGIETIIRLITH